MLFATRHHSRLNIQRDSSRLRDTPPRKAEREGRGRGVDAKGDVAADGLKTGVTVVGGATVGMGVAGVKAGVSGVRTGLHFVEDGVATIGGGLGELVVGIGEGRSSTGIVTVGLDRRPTPSKRTRRGR